MFVTVYCHPENKNEHEPCLVEMFKQYFSLIKELKRIDEAFYFRPRKTDIKFEIAPVDIPKLNSIMPFLMKEAGLEKKTAHCLRATTATNIFKGKHGELIIRERTVHISSSFLHARS